LAAEDYKSQLDSESARAQSQRAAVESELEAARKSALSAATQMSQEEERARARVAELQAQIQHMQQEAATEQGKRPVVEAELESLRKQLADWRARVEALEQERYELVARRGADDVYNAKRVAAAEAEKMVQEIEKEKAKQLRELEERRRVAAEAELSDIKVGIESRIRSAQEAAAREQKQNDEAAEADLRGELEAAIEQARSKLEQHRLLEAELQREQEGRALAEERLGALESSRAADRDRLMEEVEAQRAALQEQAAAEAAAEQLRLKSQLERMQKELNGILDDRYNLQQAMRAAQKEYGGVVAAQRPRSAAPPKPTKDQQRLKELEGAIVQAKEDYVQVLKGMSQAKQHAQKTEQQLQQAQHENANLSRQLIAASQQLTYLRAEEQRLVAALHAAQQAQEAMIEDADGHSSELAWQLSEANQQNTQLSMYINMANQRVMQLEQQLRECKEDIKDLASSAKKKKSRPQTIQIVNQMDPPVVPGSPAPYPRFEELPEPKVPALPPAPVKGPPEQYAARFRDGRYDE